jgi:hypothetical protein
METIPGATHDPDDLAEAASPRERPIFQFSPQARAADPLANARRILACRDRRHRHFPATLFGEPAWDLLLTLYVAHHEHRPIDLTRAGMAANLSAASLRRLLSRLQNQGLAERQSTQSRRPVRIALTEGAVLRLSVLLSDLGDDIR